MEATREVKKRMRKTGCLHGWVFEWISGWTVVSMSPDVVTGIVHSPSSQLWEHGQHLELEVMQDMLAQCMLCCSRILGRQGSLQAGTHWEVDGYPGMLWWLDRPVVDSRLSMVPGFLTRMSDRPQRKPELVPVLE